MHADVGLSQPQLQNKLLEPKINIFVASYIWRFHKSPILIKKIVYFSNEYVVNDTFLDRNGY